VLHGMVLRAKPRPFGFNSAVQRSPSTLDMTKAPLCPSATTWSPRFDALLSIGHAHRFPRFGPDYYPSGSNFTAAEF
jgi:hypothetical protein